nr:HAD family hydrolase [Rhizobium sp. L1K21]
MVIFDCDGVLVDSEPIALSNLRDCLSEQGLTLSTGAVSDRFLGRSLAFVISAIAEEFGKALPPQFAENLRRRLFERFERELQPTPHMAETLKMLKRHGIRFCVASSSYPDRIERSLEVTGLLSQFDDNIFSAAMVENGKPAPDLFLHAAETLGYKPAQCVVVEDTATGIRAAQAAGMPVFAFCGGTHANNDDYKASLRALRPDAMFDLMTDLLHLVRRPGRAKDNMHA